MQFLVIGRDGTDPDAPKRRAAAILDDAGGMVGSVMVVQCQDRAALDRWLEEEPYVVSGVWKDIEVAPCRVPPLFQSKA